MMTGTSSFWQRCKRLFLAACLACPCLVLPSQYVAAALHAQSGSLGVERSQLVALQKADLRLQQTFFRLVRANKLLCDDRDWSIAVVLHARTTYQGRYRDAADRLFDFHSEVAVSGLVPGGPAQVAGVLPNEGISAIDGVALRWAGVRAIAEADQAMSAAGERGRVSLSLVAGNGKRTLSVPATEVCAGRAEVQVSSSSNAGTDGDTIQLSSGLLNEVADDEQLAAVIAHELAHAVLHHPARLTTARVSRGLFSEFGRNRRLILQTETEADRLSLYLLANAGFDPRAAIAFWRGPGAGIGAGILASGTHLRPANRIRLLTQELAQFPAAPSLPIIPAWLASRSLPLD